MIHVGLLKVVSSSAMTAFLQRELCKTSVRRYLRAILDGGIGSVKIAKVNASFAPRIETALVLVQL